MNKFSFCEILSFFKRKGLILVISILLLLFFTFLFICSSYSQCVHHIWIDRLKHPQIVAILGISIICILLCLAFRKRYKKAISRFISPFDKRGRELFFGIITLILIVIIGAILFHFFYHRSSEYDDFSFFNLTSFSLCLFSIFLTSRVYFEIGKEKTSTLDEYLERLTDIIANSKAKDKILIIAPTIVLGQARKDSSYIKEGYINAILRFLEKGDITFALLNFDIEKLEAINIRYDAKKANISKAEYTTIPDTITKKSLFDYHFETWKLYVNSQDKIGELMDDLQSTLIDLNETKKGIFIGLKSDMYIEKKDYTRSRGFFAVANFTQGLYYMGSFNVSGKIHKFQGTYFENEHIETQMRHMLKCAIEDYCIKEDKDKLSLIYQSDKENIN